MNSDYVREVHIGKTNNYIDFYTKMELVEVLIVITLINIAFLFTLHQDQLFHCVCEEDPISFLLIKKVGIMGVDIFYSVFVFVIFLAVKWFEKLWNVKTVGVFIFLILIGVHLFDVYHDYTVFIAGGY